MKVRMFKDYDGLRAGQVTHLPDALAANLIEQEIAGAIKSPGPKEKKPAEPPETK